MNVYLDIDGVFIAPQNRTADYADKFLQFVIQNWPNTTYWLTSYCRDGENRAQRILEPHLSRKTLSLLDHIQPLRWDELKTDAISFKQPFLWFDDNLYSEEAEILAHYNALECHHMINLTKNPYQLLDELVYLRSLV